MNHRDRPHYCPTEPDPILDVCKDLIRDNGACCPRIEIDWDQWARASIVCEHGAFEAVSNGLNLTQSLRRAYKAFNSYEHHPLSNEGQHEQ